MFRRTVDIHRTLDIRKVPNIRKILLPLDGRNRTHGVSRVSKVREDKASGPVLDAEEVTISLSMNARSEEHTSELQSRP